MRAIFIFLILLLAGKLSAQESIFYLNEKSTYLTIKVKDEKVGDIYVTTNSKTGFDTFHFILQYDEGKGYSASKTKLSFKNFKLLSDEFLKGMGACELHDFFSSNTVYVVSEQGGEYRGIALFYEGTSRNILKSRSF